MESPNDTISRPELSKLPAGAVRAGRAAWPAKAGVTALNSAATAVQAINAARLLRVPMRFPPLCP
jgi:hypothetical protein